MIEKEIKKLEQLEREVLAEKRRRVVENQLAHYVAYKKQAEFHEAGAKYRERLLCAANQSGKTLAGGMEAAMHATGRYPEDWKGKRFDGPTVGWVAGTTNETTRDTVQRILLGRDSERGTGCLPKECILDLVEEREKIIASYPPHEREARTKGVPTLGSGRVFPRYRRADFVQAHANPITLAAHWWARLRISPSSC